MADDHLWPSVASLCILDVTGLRTTRFTMTAHVFVTVRTSDLNLDIS
jgi:hypothetical protein